MIITHMKAEIPSEESSKLEESITHIDTECINNRTAKQASQVLCYKLVLHSQLISILVISHTFSLKLVGFFTLIGRNRPWPMLLHRLP